MPAPTDYLAGFGEDPGYLDYAAFGPLSSAVVAEAGAQEQALRRARWGLRERVEAGAGRFAAAAAAATGFRPDQTAFQPSAAQGLMQAVFGVTGGVLVPTAAHPALTVAVGRAAEVLQTVVPVPFDADGGRVTPGGVRERLTSSIAAVLVSAVDERTGHVADLDGLRQVVGDRLLIVDATEALGAVDGAWAAADVLVAGGETWLRAGFGGALLAVSDRAAERLTPVFSGYAGAAPAASGTPSDADSVPAPAAGAAGLQVSPPDPVASARLATALEELTAAGQPVVAAAVAERTQAVLDAVDRFGLPVVSPRAPSERAGIVVVDPLPERLTALSAALFNHGVSVTVRDARVRFSPHAGTTEETIGMLRSALTAYANDTRAVR